MASRAVKSRSDGIADLPSSPAAALAVRHFAVVLRPVAHQTRQGQAEDDDRNAGEKRRGPPAKRLQTENDQGHRKAAKGVAHLGE